MSENGSNRHGGPEQSLVQWLHAWSLEWDDALKAPGGNVPSRELLKAKLEIARALESRRPVQIDINGVASKVVRNELDALATVVAKERGALRNLMLGQFVDRHISRLAMLTLERRVSKLEKR